MSWISFLIFIKLVTFIWIWDQEPLGSASWSVWIKNQSCGLESKSHWPEIQRIGIQFFLDFNGKSNFFWKWIQLNFYSVLTVFNNQISLQFLPETFIWKLSLYSFIRCNVFGILYWKSSSYLSNKISCIFYPFSY